MRDFDLTQLRTLVAVADTGSLSAAARVVFLSQSSVSEQLKKLEERAGQQLLDRSKSGCVATPAGEKLLGYARRMLALSEAALEDLQGRSLDGELRIGLSDYFLPREAARVLKRFGELHPRLRLHSSVLKSAIIEQGIDPSGELPLDIGVSVRFVSARGRHVAGGEALQGSMLLRREPLFWVMAADADIAASPPLPLVTVQGPCPLQQLMQHLLERAGIHYRTAFTVSGVAGLQLALAAGQGITCLNLSAINRGLRECPSEMRLPTLPQAEFRLTPPRAGEAPTVTEARVELAKLFRWHLEEPPKADPAR
ncbi:LysR family transcriptional regulator [Niveibacterium sp. SC-1]|uniref:LysR family transcriptional regulator n=1 Tax=Niveibacterium sp. SC-1 TaxID=3135646 RepID=UPI00311F2979